MKRQLIRIKLTALVLLFGLAWLVIDGAVMWALAATGGLVIFLGGWLIALAPAIWHDYDRKYKRLPRTQRTIWNQPSRAYYLANRWIIAPMLIVLGVLLIWLAIILHSIR